MWHKKTSLTVTVNVTVCETDVHLTLTQVFFLMYSPKYIYLSL